MAEDLRDRGLVEVGRYENGDVSQRTGGAVSRNGA